MGAVRAMLAIASFAVLAACGAVADVPSDAGASDAAVDASDATTLSFKRRTNDGFVGLQSTRGNATNNGTAFVHFGTLSDCGEATFEGCTVWDCPSDVQPPGKSVAAGTVVVEGTTPPVAIVPDKTYYAVQHLNGQLWGGGEKIRARAEGNTAPAFDLSVVAPSYVTVTSPTLSPKITISRSMDFVVTWSGGGEGKVVVELQVYQSSVGPGMAVDCGFPASAGSGKIPQEVLRVLPANWKRNSVQVTSQSIAEVASQGWHVSLNAVANAEANGYGDFVFE